MDVSDFFCAGEGKGEPEAPGSGGGGAVSFFILKIQEGGGSSRRGRGARGQEAVGILGRGWD